MSSTAGFLLSSSTHETFSLRVRGGEQRRQRGVGWFEVEVHLKDSKCAATHPVRRKCSLSCLLRRRASSFSLAMSRASLQWRQRRKR